MSHQYATIEDTVYFYFGANDTSGSGGDGASPLFDVREAGAAAGAIPLLSGTPTLLTHANYPAGCYEVAVAATAVNGFAADDTFGVFCTLAIDSQNPTGFVGSCTLTPIAKTSELAKVPKSDSTVTWNATAAAQIQSEANDALVVNNLDHLMNDAVADNDDMTTEVPDGTVLSNIMTKTSDTSDYAVSEYALHAISDKIGQIALTGAAVNQSAESYLLTTGTQTGVIGNTVALDGVFHQHTDDTGAMDLYYQFDVGGDGVPTGTTVTGYVTGQNDDLDVFAYNWGTTTWDQVGNIQGTAIGSNDPHPFTLFTGHVGTSGADLGKVRIRFYKASGLTTADLFIDQIYVSYAIVTRSIGYQNGAVWYDDNNGTAGSEAYVNGTADKPCSVWADVLSLLSSLGLSAVHALPGASITLDDDFQYKLIEGSQYTLVTAGYDISGSRVSNCTSITGVSTGTLDRYAFIFSGIGNVTLDPSDMFECGFFATITIGTAGVFTWGAAATTLPHGTKAIIDFGAGLGASQIEMQSWGGGGIELQNMGAGAGNYSFSAHGWGEVEINANCSATSDVNLYGNFELTNNASGITIENEANYSETHHDAIITANSSIANLDVAVSTRLAPTAAGRTLDITAAGLAGISLDNTSGTLDAAQFGADYFTAVVTALEADGGKISSLMEALVNKLIIEEATGTAEMFNDAGVSQGTVVAAFETDGTYTSRKRMLI